tara:strand:+ start:2349 stop:3023 length:675 start_codon:yes stop_codon:yes gene_type:complete
MKTRKEVEIELSALISGKLESSIKEKGYATLLVSGGSTPLQLFNLLSNEDIDWGKVNIIPVDERFLPDGHPDQNGTLIRTHLLINKASTARFYPLIFNSVDAELNLHSVESSIKQVNLPFTVVILGMGADGHTASLFPCCKELDQGLDLNNTAKLIITNPNTAPYQRISFTRKALLDTENLYLHCYGDEKKQILDTLDLNSEQTYPIKAFIAQKNIKPEIFWSK